MSQLVRVGIVGASEWTEWMYLSSLKHHPCTTLQAICSRNRTNAETMAQKYGIAGVFTDYRDMLARGNIEALIIATPDDTHYTITMDALDAGLHILCEKPLATTAQQARAMYEKAEMCGVKHMVLFTYRWMPQYQYIRELIAEGYLGRCFHADLRFFMDYGREGEYAWRFDRRRASGVLGDLGSHMVDMARWYLGEIVSVSAHLAAFIERPGVDNQSLHPANDSALLLLELACGTHATIRVSAITHPIDRYWQQQVALYGEHGSLEADIHLNGVVRGARRGGDRGQFLSIPDRLWGGADQSDPFNVLFQSSTGARLFIDAIAEDRPVSPTFYDGLKAQEVIDAALESAQSGCREIVH